VTSDMVIRQAIWSIDMDMTEGVVSAKKAYSLLMTTGASIKDIKVHLEPKNLAKIRRYMARGVDRPGPYHFIA